MTAMVATCMVERDGPLASRVVRAVHCAEVRLTALPPMTRLIIRGNAVQVASMGMTAPEPCYATTNGERSLLWLGPEEFLLLLPASAGRGPAGAIDVSHRDVALTVSGPRAVWVLNAFCALDLHHATFPVGRCTRTLFGKAGILLWRTHVDTFRIDVARSFAPYVWDCLEEARREFLD
jgi:heterotetrameric sarcosine oxidase gamma subunit